MLSEMSWTQFCRWSQYSKVEPFGEERADLRAGIIASITANAHRDPKKSRPFKPSDFMPKFLDSKAGKRKPLTDPKEWKSVLRKAKKVFGGKDE